MADEEIPEGESSELPTEEVQPDEPVAEPAPAAEPVGSSKSGPYTLLLILSFVACLTSIILAGRELYRSYDVMFFVFSK